MTRPFVKGEAIDIVINTGDEKLQRMGRKLCKQLMQQLDPGRAVSVLYVALTEGLVGILHIESPIPEANIAAIEQLIDALRDNVGDHFDCAKNLSQHMKTVQAIENGEIEPPEKIEPRIH